MNYYAFVSPGIAVRFNRDEVTEILKKAITLKESGFGSKNIVEGEFNYFKYRSESIFWRSHNCKMMKGCTLNISIMLAEEYSKIIKGGDNVQPENQTGFDTKALQDCEKNKKADDKSSEQNP